MTSRVRKRKRVLKLDSSAAEIWPGQFSSKLHPQFETHSQTVNRRKLVPVIIGPKFHRPDRTAEEKELWAKDVVILFKPWRTPLDLKAVDESWTHAADGMLDTLEPWQRRIIRNMNVLTECRDAR
ncbi:hypothetical protein DFH09DRAFT_957822, partial [Mycena vulgaris]